MALAPVIAAGPALADAYGLNFELRITADSPVGEARITVSQDEALLREARFSAPADRFDNFAGDGDVIVSGDKVTWIPPESGGTLGYDVRIERTRSDLAYDAMIETDWGLFRLDRVFPPARVTHLRGSRSETTLELKLPKGWSAETPYAEIKEDVYRYRVRNAHRRFDRPTGWVVIGDIGVRKDMIGGVEISIGAPVGMGVERIGMLALLRWNLPALFNEIDTPLPARINIVSAGDPMWRGGLSARNSLYIHADRPLLSENATSTLLHEIVHLLMPVPDARRHDWIDEGLAEYLSLLTLANTGTISPDRFSAAIDGFRRRGEAVSTMSTAMASGSVKARAVAIFADLDAEIRAATDNEADLFDLTRTMMAQTSDIDLDRLRELARDLTGSARIRALSARQVPGFD